jgi:hypothetical protein
VKVKASPSASVGEMAVHPYSFPDAAGLFLRCYMRVNYRYSGDIEGQEEVKQEGVLVKEEQSLDAHRRSFFGKSPFFYYSFMRLIHGVFL